MQILYQDNYLPFKPMETGKGEGPCVPVAVLPHPISPPSRWVASNSAI